MATRVCWKGGGWEGETDTAGCHPDAHGLNGQAGMRWLKICCKGRLAQGRGKPALFPKLEESSVYVCQVLAGGRGSVLMCVPVRISTVLLSVIY